MAYRNDTPTLARRSLDQRFAALRNADSLSRPPRGWIKAVREALGMTTAQLAGRLGLSQPRISQLERAELEERASLASLRQAAAGLQCRLVYYFVPLQPLADLVQERAEQVAEGQLQRADQTMRLEDQALAPDDLAAERGRLVAELLRGDPRRLWDEP